MPVERLIGVYRADGGVIGEFRYLIDHYLRGQSCTLCDITHSPFRRKSDWDRQVAHLGIPFELLHLNELNPSLATFVGDRAACVLAETGGERVMLLSNDELADFDGSVDAFFAALKDRLGRIATP